MKMGLGILLSLDIGERLSLKLLRQDGRTGIEKKRHHDCWKMIRR